MKSLYDSLTELPYIDCHFHVIDRHKNIYKSPLPLAVAFIDVEPKHIEDYKDCEYLYKNIHNDHNILLATGTEPDDIIKIHQKYKLKGFGEIKCHSGWKGHEIDKGLKYYEPVFDYDSSLGQPIYIHWTLFNEERILQLADVLERYPGIPFVLCHCGMGDKTLDDMDKERIHLQLQWLLCKYPNLYTDITYTALDYYSSHINALLTLPVDKCMLGTDINPYLMESDNSSFKVNQILNNIQSLHQYVNSDACVRKLFII